MLLVVLQFLSKWVQKVEDQGLPRSDMVKSGKVSTTAPHWHLSCCTTIDSSSLRSVSIVYLVLVEEINELVVIISKVVSSIHHPLSYSSLSVVSCNVVLYLSKIITTDSFSIHLVCITCAAETTQYEMLRISGQKFEGNVQLFLWWQILLYIAIVIFRQSVLLSEIKHIKSDWGI